MMESLAPRWFQDLLFQAIVHEAANYVPRRVRVTALGAQRPVDPFHGDGCGWGSVEDHVKQSRHLL